MTFDMGQLVEEYMPKAPLGKSVLQALRQLPDVARTCLLLRVVREMTYAEIAAALDIPAGTAMSHVHRTRKKLRRLLEPAPLT